MRLPCRFLLETTNRVGSVKVTDTNSFSLRFYRAVKRSEMGMALTKIDAGQFLTCSFVAFSAL